MTINDNKLQNNMVNNSEETQLIPNEETQLFNNNGVEADEETQLLNPTAPKGADNEDDDEITTPLGGQGTDAAAMTDPAANGNGHKKAKIAAGVAGAAAVVGGAAFGAVHFLGDKDSKTADNKKPLGSADEEEDLDDQNQNNENDAENHGNDVHDNDGRMTDHTHQFADANHHSADANHHSADANHHSADANHHSADANQHGSAGRNETNNGHHAGENGHAGNAHTQQGTPVEGLHNVAQGAAGHHNISTADNHNGHNTHSNASSHSASSHDNVNHNGENTADVFDIESINAVVGDEGVELVDVEARYNGHDARFIADADGRLIVGAVDLDDNGEITDDEVMDFSDTDASINDLKALDNVHDNDYIHEAVNVIDNTSDEPTFDVLVAEVDEDGEFITVEARYNGNEAGFLADGEGNLIMGAIDMDGNGEISEDEIVDFSDSDATIADLVALDNVDGEIDEVIFANYEGEGDDNEVADVQVLGFEENVVVDGEVFNAAAVVIDEEPMVFLDTTQNGEVDIVVADLNGDGEIADDECIIVTNEHMAMPTADDVIDDSFDNNLYEANNYDDSFDNNLYEANNYDDYSGDYNNDADVSFYDA